MKQSPPTPEDAARLVADSLVAAYTTGTSSRLSGLREQLSEQQEMETFPDSASFDWPEDEKNTFTGREAAEFQKNDSAPFARLYTDSRDVVNLANEFGSFSLPAMDGNKAVSAKISAGSPLSLKERETVLGYAESLCTLGKKRTARQDLLPRPAPEHKSIYTRTFEALGRMENPETRFKAARAGALMFSFHNLSLKRQEEKQQKHENALAEKTGYMENSAAQPFLKELTESGYADEGTLRDGARRIRKAVRDLHEKGAEGDTKTVLNAAFSKENDTPALSEKQVFNPFFDRVAGDFINRLQTVNDHLAPERGRIRSEKEQNEGARHISRRFQDFSRDIMNTAREESVKQEAGRLKLPARGGTSR